MALIVTDQHPIARADIDEALCLARYIEQHADRVDVVSCTGVWSFPVTDVQPMAQATTPS